jgi:hypothetical protein
MQVNLPSFSRPVTFGEAARTEASSLPLIALRYKSALAVKRLDRGASRKKKMGDPKKMKKNSDGESQRVGKGLSKPHGYDPSLGQGVCEGSGLGAAARAQPSWLALGQG